LAEIIEGAVHGTSDRGRIPVTLRGRFSRKKKGEGEVIAFSVSGGVGKEKEGAQASKNSSNGGICSSWG